MSAVACEVPHTSPIPLSDLSEPLGLVLSSKLRVDALLEVILEAASDIDEGVKLVLSGRRNPAWINERCDRIAAMGEIAADLLKMIGQQMDVADALIATNSIHLEIKS